MVHGVDPLLSEDADAALGEGALAVENIVDASGKNRRRVPVGARVGEVAGQHAVESLVDGVFGGGAGIDVEVAEKDLGALVAMLKGGEDILSLIVAALGVEGVEVEGDDGDVSAARGIDGGALGDASACCWHGEEATMKANQERGAPVPRVVGDRASPTSAKDGEEAAKLFRVAHLLERDDVGIDRADHLRHVAEVSVGRPRLPGEVEFADIPRQDAEPSPRAVCRDEALMDEAIQDEDTEDRKEGGDGDQPRDDGSGTAFGGASRWADCVHT